MIQEFYDKVHQIKQQAYNCEKYYDVDGIHQLMAELEEMDKPFRQKMEELQSNEFVKEYIENKKVSDFLSSSRQSLIGCLPK